MRTHNCWYERQDSILITMIKPSDPALSPRCWSLRAVSHSLIGEIYLDANLSQLYYMYNSLPYQYCNITPEQLNVKVLLSDGRSDHRIETIEKSHGFQVALRAILNLKSCCTLLAIKLYYPYRFVEPWICFGIDCFIHVEFSGGKRV